MIAVVVGAALLVLGSVESPTFNGLDILGWGVLTAGVVSLAFKSVRS